MALKPGRPKGVKNKVTIELQERAAKFKLQPFEMLMMVINNKAEDLGYEKGDKFEPALRVKAATEVSRYLYPTQKAIEISASEDAGIKIVVEDYKKKNE